MADIRIRIGHATEEMQEDRRAATEEFAEQLRAAGLSVDVEVIERIPGRYGVTLVEWVAFFIGSGVANSLISNLTTDLLYEPAKQWLRSHRQAKKEKQGNPGRHLGLVIFGPDGKELRRWDTRDDD